MVTEVKIVGNQRISTDKILAQIRTRAGRPFNPRLIEEDVRRLNQTRWFASVRVYWQPVPEGRAVIFEVLERPLIQYVKIVGNEWYPKKRLLETAGIRPGDGMDPFLVEQARRKIEDFYREHGFPRARVSLVEGSNPQDPGVIFLVSEGPRQRILWTSFVGNTISSDGKLRTKVQSKPGWFWLIRGFYNPEELERDRLRVLEYYRSLGFFRAQVGEPIVEFNDDRTWARVRFVVDEGPRYAVREVKILGNTLFPEDELYRLLKLQPGRYFSQAEMDADVKALQEKFGSIGYIFADIRAEPRFLEEPGQLDLIYSIQQGVRCRVGRIDVVIKDQYNTLTHTQWSTVLNRISLAPGDIVDIRELRASERRLRASGLFEVDPAKGIVPKIVVVPPNPEEVEALLARQRNTQTRGQNPSAGSPALPPLLQVFLPPSVAAVLVPPWQSRLSDRNDPSETTGDYFAVLRLEAQLAKEPRPQDSPAEEETGENQPETDQSSADERVECPSSGFSSKASLGCVVDLFGESSDLSAAENTGPLGLARKSTAEFRFTSTPEEGNLADRPASAADGWPKIQVQDPEFNSHVPGLGPSPSAGTPSDQSSTQIVRGQYTPEGGISLWPLRPARPAGRPPIVQVPAGSSGGVNPYGSGVSLSPALGGDAPLADGSQAASVSPPASTPWAVTNNSSSASGGSTVPGGYPEISSSGGLAPGTPESVPVETPRVTSESAPSWPSSGSSNPVSAGATPVAEEPTVSSPRSATSSNQPGSPVPPSGASGTFPRPPSSSVVPVPTPPPQIAPDVLSPLRGEPPDQEPTLPVPLQPEVYEGRTGRMMISAGINSDAGLMGSFIIDEQNFDWRRWPRSWEDIRSGRAWRGAGQRFRLEAVPGTEVQRYMVSFQEPFLFDTDISLGLSGYFYNRKYAEWDEDRLGGRVAFGYQFTHDLSGTFAIRAAQIKVYDPSSPPGLVPELDEVLGSNTLVGFGVTLSHDTRDSAFLPTEGHFYEISFEQVIGSFDYPRGELELRHYFLLRQHPDGSGRHVMSLSTRLAYTGADTPIYEHYFAGGYSSLRGFSFRGASPRSPVTGLTVGGHFMLLASAEYMFPVTADDLLRIVLFCDTGVVQPDIDDWEQRYRVALGFGFRITLPALGPAPIALDFAFPVSKEPGDDEQVFSFFLGFFR